MLLQMTFHLPKGISFERFHANTTWTGNQEIQQWGDNIQFVSFSPQVYAGRTLCLGHSNPAMWALPMAKRFVQTDWRNELATIHDAANHHDIGDHDKPYFNPAQSNKMCVFFHKFCFCFIRYTCLLPIWFRKLTEAATSNMHTNQFKGRKNIQTQTSTSNAIIKPSSLKRLPSTPSLYSIT